MSKHIACCQVHCTKPDGLHHKYTKVNHFACANTTVNFQYVGGGGGLGEGGNPSGSAYAWYHMRAFNCDCDNQSPYVFVLWGLGIRD